MSGKPRYDSAVWAPPEDGPNGSKAPEPAPSAFMLRFQNRSTFVGKDGTNANLVAVPPPPQQQREKKSTSNAPPLFGRETGNSNNSNHIVSNKASGGGPNSVKQRGILSPEELAREKKRKKLQDQLKQQQPVRSATTSSSGNNAHSTETDSFERDMSPHSSSEANPSYCGAGKQVPPHRGIPSSVKQTRNINGSGGGHHFRKSTALDNRSPIIRIDKAERKEQGIETRQMRFDSGEGGSGLVEGTQLETPGRVPQLQLQPPQQRQRPTKISIASLNARSGIPITKAATPNGVTRQRSFTSYPPGSATTQRASHPRQTPTPVYPRRPNSGQRLEPLSPVVQQRSGSSTPSIPFPLVPSTPPQQQYQPTVYQHIQYSIASEEEGGGGGDVDDSYDNDVEIELVEVDPFAPAPTTRPLFVPTGVLPAPSDAAARSFRGDVESAKTSHQGRGPSPSYAGLGSSRHDCTAGVAMGDPSDPNTAAAAAAAARVRASRAKEREAAAAAAAAQQEARRNRRRINPGGDGEEGDGAKAAYTPYTLEDYNTMIEKVSNQRAGGLGPADTDEQRRAREKKARELAYGKQAEKATIEALQQQQRQKAESMKAVEGEGEGGPTDEQGTTLEQQQVQKRTFDPPTPKEVRLARERRQRALEYARLKVPAPVKCSATSASRGESCSDECRSGDDEIGHDERTGDGAAGKKGKKKRRGSRLLPQDAEALKREQRLLDLEAKHHQNKAAVDHIRKQLRV